MGSRTYSMTAVFALMTLCAACGKEPESGTRRSTQASARTSVQPPFNPSTIPLFSPDSSHIAVLWEVLDTREATYVRWFSSDKPEAYRQLELASKKLVRRRIWLSRQYHMAFSPDSAFLAIAGPSDLTVIDMATNAHWRMETPGQPITSLVWLDKGRICYVVAEAGKRLVCSQGVKEPLSLRKVLCEAPGISEDQRRMFDVGLAWPLEHWSSDRRYAVVATDEGACLLNVGKGSLRQVGRSHLVGATWSPDGRRVFCVGERGRGYEALLIMPAEDKTLDLSAPFNREFDNDSISETVFVRAGETVPTGRWTPDGEGLVFNVYKHGAILLRLEPWQVFPVGQYVQGWLKQQSPAIFGLPAHFSLTGEGYDPQVDPLPLPGLLLCSLPKIGRDCLVDYQGNVVIVLDDVQFIEGVIAGPTISPDGCLVATAITPGELVLQKVNLSASRPAGSTQAPRPSRDR
jgi:hypothetical protein